MEFALAGHSAECGDFIVAGAGANNLDKGLIMLVRRAVWGPPER